MIDLAIKKMINKQHLADDLAQASLNEIMEGKASDAQIASFITALSLKGETIEEIVALAKAIRAKAESLAYKEALFEIVGTGGDGANTFNISTTASFVIAASGIKVAKHGNRSVSSLCGSADCLEALGANIELSAEQNQKMLDTVGMCFMYAPKYHKSMKFVAPVRKELGFRSVFNLLGPLVNPANANYQLMGVYKAELVEPMARVLQQLGIKKGAVVCGYDGLDEISICNKTLICEFTEREYKTYTFDPKKFGLNYATKQEVQGGDKYTNAKITTAILSGEQNAKRDAVILNAGMGIYLRNDDITLAQAITKATDLIDTGSALAKMQEFIAYSNEVV